MTKKKPSKGSPGSLEDRTRYAAGAFRSATRALAVSHEPLRERLRAARREFNAVTADDFPNGSEEREEFVQLHAGLARGTVESLSDAEALRLAALVFDIRTGLDC